MNRNILVPLDGSPLAEQILPFVVALARSGAEVTLLSAVVPFDTWIDAGGVYAPTSFVEDEVKAAAAYLETQRQHLEAQEIVVHTTIARGAAAACIREVAAASDAWLIAMTTHGRSGLPRYVQGSVASEVVRTSSQPVLLIRATEHAVEHADLSRILVPVDGSAMSESVIPAAEGLARTVGAEIVLLRVVTPPMVLYPGEVVPSAPPVLDDLEAAARSYLVKLAAAVRHDGLRVQLEVVTGEATEAIVEAADRFDAGLIAMSSHGRTGLARALIGSTAEGVVRQSTKPVLVVRPKAVVDEQLSKFPPAGIEVIEGMSVAPTLVPPPEITETQLTGQTGHPHEVPAHSDRPERRSLS